MCRIRTGCLPGRAKAPLFKSASSKTREMPTKSKKGRSTKKPPPPPPSPCIIPSPTESQTKKLLQEGDENIGEVLKEELTYSSSSSGELNLDTNQVEKVFVNLREGLNRAKGQLNTAQGQLDAIEKDVNELEKMLVAKTITPQKKKAYDKNKGRIKGGKGEGRFDNRNRKSGGNGLRGFEDEEEKSGDGDGGGGGIPAQGSLPLSLPEWKNINNSENLDTFMDDMKKRIAYSKKESGADKRTINSCSTYVNTYKGVCSFINKFVDAAIKKQDEKKEGDDSKVDVVEISPAAKKKAHAAIQKMLNENAEQLVTELKGSDVKSGGAGGQGNRRYTKKKQEKNWKDVFSATQNKKENYVKACLEKIIGKEQLMACKNTIAAIVLSPNNNNNKQ